MPPYGNILQRDHDIQFPDCRIGRGWLIPMKPRNPDLSQTDFSVKDIIYSEKVNSTEDCH
jgi:hypothetical protein